MAPYHLSRHFRRPASPEKPSRGAGAGPDAAKPDDPAPATRRSGQPRREAEERLPDSPEFKATQFDGDPSPQADDPGGTFSPPDETPAVLEKRQGPRNERK